MFYTPGGLAGHFVLWSAMQNQSCPMRAIKKNMSDILLRVSKSADGVIPYRGPLSSVSYQDKDGYSKQVSGESAGGGAAAQPDKLRKHDGS
jgi:hypothetical protein